MKDKNLALGEIHIHASRHPDAKDDIALRGRYTVTLGESGVPAVATDVAKHIVLVVSRAGNHQAVSPFQDTFVFGDDFKLEDGRISGQFSLNVMDHIAFGGGAGDYYILCSLGSHLSNVEKFSC